MRTFKQYKPTINGNHKYFTFLPVQGKFPTPEKDRQVAENFIVLEIKYFCKEI